VIEVMSNEEFATAADQVHAGSDGPGDAPGSAGKPKRGAPPARRYGLLLAILIASYLLSAFFTSRWITDVQLGLFTVAGLLAIRNSPLRRGYARIVVTVAFVCSLLMIVVADHNAGPIGRGAADAWAGLLLLLMVVVILRQILAAPEVTLQSIYGAISAYLIIGLMFAAFYGAMYYLDGGRFFAENEPASAANFQYFSFTTLTTLGYGDFTAAENAGRAIAMLEAMTGQIFLATLVAKLVSSFRTSREATPPT
jgi:Ion channel